MLNKIFNSKILLVLILLLAIYARLYKFENPLSDWHSWRQVDTSSVSRNFVKDGFNILHPTFHDLSIGVSLLDNPNGYRFVEFPFYNVFQAELFLLFGKLTLEQWGRVVTILASLGMIVFVYLLTKKYVSPLAGIFSALFLSLAPYSIYYGRTVLPDMLMTAFMMGGLYFFDKWVETNSKFKIQNSKLQFKTQSFFILALILTAGAILMKPFVLFFGLPFLVLAWKKFEFSLFKKIELYLFLVLSVLPFILWRLWMQQYPEGIPQSNWLFNGNGIRFKGAFFQWLFAERISRLILGYFGLPFVILGILAKIKKESLLFISMIISSVVYMSVIATGNVQHDYYQILILPTIAIFFGKGIDFVLTHAGDLFNKYISYVVVGVSFIFMFSFSWYLIRDYYTLQHFQTVVVGSIADKLLPKDAKVIAPFGGDTSFLYYINRQGWPVVDRSFIDFIKDGATHIVFVDPGNPELNLANYFTTVGKGVNYLILDLTKPLPRSVEILTPEEE